MKNSVLFFMDPIVTYLITSTSDMCNHTSVFLNEIIIKLLQRIDY